MSELKLAATSGVGVNLGPRVALGQASPIQVVVAYILGILLVLHAGLRPVYADLDSIIYRSWFDELSRIDSVDFFALLIDGGWIFAARVDSLAKFEWGFSLLAWLLGQAGLSATGFFLVVALLSVLPKVWIINRYTSNPVLALLWYVSLCYLLLEMNAMRAGLAGTFLFLAMDSYIRRQRFTVFLWVVLAASMHLSALAAVAIPIFLTLSGSAFAVVAVLLTALVVGQLDFSVVLASLGGVFDKIGEYKRALDQGFGDVAYTRLNPINLTSLNIMMVGSILLYRASVVRAVGKHEVGALPWLFFFSILPLFLFASFPIVGGRLFEFLAMFQVFGIAWLASWSGRKLAMQIIIGVAICLQFWIQNFRTSNVDFFYFIGEPKAQIIKMAEQKIVIDAVLNRLFEGD